MREFFARKMYEGLCVIDKYMALLVVQAAVANHHRLVKKKIICYSSRDSEVQIQGPG